MMKQIIIKRFKDLFFKAKHYSIAFALYDFIWWMCFYLRPPFAYKLSSFVIRKKTAWLDRYISLRYSDIIESYRTKNLDQAPVENYKIWVFGGQGEENMPPLIRACHRQLTHFNHNVTLVTNQNVDNYISLSPVIMDKVLSGHITWAHYSDIVRNTLLAQYGGLWLDATVWVSGKIPFEKLSQLSLFSSNGKVPITNHSIRFWTSFEYNWSSWCLFANAKKYKLFEFVSEMLQAIAINERCWPDYVIQDYLILYACRNFQQVRNDMQKCQKYECKYRNRLAELMNSPWSEKDYLNLIKADFVFKLSFRSKWKRYDPSGKQTFYGKITTSPFLDSSLT